ncbi:MAG: peptidoglycan DD-metalloendopeptidase family protein [Bacillota bacterium]|nr:peptidoglycan DD-metalloendopeptidase family protein [Bacillota bacterium]
MVKHLRNKLLYIVLTAVLLLGCALLLGGVAAFASETAAEQQAASESASSEPMTIEEYRELQQNSRQRMEELRQEIESIEADSANYRAEIAALDAEMAVIGQEMQAAQAVIESTNLLIEECILEIDLANQRLAERQKQLESRLVDLYVYGDISLLDVLFESVDFDSFIVLYDMIDMLMQNDQRLLDGIEEERALIEEEKTALELRRMELIELQESYRIRHEQLAELEFAKAAALDQAQMSMDELEAMLDAEEAEAAAAGEMIRELLLTSDSSLKFSGALYWPTPGYFNITSPYGGRNHPITGVYHTHSGIDIGADGGSPIYAAGDGKIIYVGWLGGYGQTVMVDHGDGLVTLYAHMSAYGGFSVGDYVIGAVDIIGYVGTTGNSTGNHLHFEVRLNGSHTDPGNYLSY